MTTFSHQENRQELFQLVEQIVQDREKLGAHPQDTATRTRLAAAEAELSKSFDAPEGFCWCDIVLGEARAMGKHSQSIDPGPFEVILEDAVKKAKAVRDLIQKFVEHVTWILILDRIVDELFQNAAAQKLMEDTAPEFLKVMNRLTINNLILSLCRTTEPAQTGTHSNLTVQQVVNSTCWDDCRKPRVKQIEKRCDSFHSELKGVRDKLLAHKDLEWIMKKNIRSCLSEDIHKKVKKVLEQLDCLDPTLVRATWESVGRACPPRRRGRCT